MPKEGRLLAFIQISVLKCPCFSKEAPTTSAAVFRQQKPGCLIIGVCHSVSILTWFHNMVPMQFSLVSKKKSVGGQYTGIEEVAGVLEKKDNVSN